MSYTRISARRGSPVALPVRTVRGGVVQDPFAFYRVEIYRGKVAPDNIVEIIQIPAPESSEYPSPLVSNATGEYVLNWNVPDDAIAPDVYFDVWYFYGTDPRSLNSGSEPEGDLADYESKLVSQCNRFWVYPDSWYLDGGLQTIRLGFEPLDLKFRKPEVRPLEVGMMPLPLYDYDFNLVAPLLPYVDATISIWTENNEPVVTNEAMTIKLRQGAYRSNPFVLSYLLDTSNHFIGTYKYRITITLPDGSTRVSQDFILTIS